MLLGDAGKARSVLGWEAETSLEMMIREMVDADLERLQNPRSYVPRSPAL